MRKTYVLQSVNNENLINNHGVYESRFETLRAARELMMIDSDVFESSINILEIFTEDDQLASVSNSIVLKKENSKKRTSLLTD